MKYDLLVLCHPKDYIKLKYCLNSCWDHLTPQPDNVYVVSPDNFSTWSSLHVDGPVIKHIFDDDAIPVTKKDINYRRANWIWKMLVNLFQDFTENDYYLTVDSDLIFNNTHELFIDEKPVFFISDRDQHHIPYFDFMAKWSGLKRQTNYTFINDFMMLNKNICREMLPDLDTFVDFCNKNLSEDCLLADYEIYGNYVEKHHKGTHHHIASKTKMFGKYVQQPWNEQEIIELISHMKNFQSQYDLFTIHSWT